MRPLTIPNLLSFIRLLASPFILWSLYEGRMQAACILLLIACITDAMDGYIARRWKQESTLGKYLDPLADKVLMLSLLLGLYYFDKIHAFLVIAALARDVCIMGGILSLHLQGKKFVMEPITSSKVSTLSQMVLCCLILFNWGFALGISSQILYYGEKAVTLGIIYSFVQYMVIWWNIQKTK